MKIINNNNILNYIELNLFMLTQNLYKYEEIVDNFFLINFPEYILSKYYLTGQIFPTHEGSNQSCDCIHWF